MDDSGQQRSGATGPDGAGAPEALLDLGRRARAAVRRLANATADEKNAALHAMAARIRSDGAAILDELEGDTLKAI